MRIHIARWGNSLAIRIPKNYAETAGLQEGMAVHVTAESDALVIKRSHTPLDDLLSRVTKLNLHDEADWGGPVGNEAW